MLNYMLCTIVINGHRTATDGKATQHDAQIECGILRPSPYGDAVYVNAAVENRNQRARLQRRRTAPYVLCEQGLTHSLIKRPISESRHRCVVLTEHIVSAIAMWTILS